MSGLLKVASGCALGMLLFGVAPVRAEEPGFLSLRVPEAERLVSIRTPTQVEIETTLPGALLSLFVEGRVVLMSNQPKAKWRLDPNRWLQRGTTTRRVKLLLVAYQPKGVKVERTLFVHLGELPALLAP